MKTETFLHTNARYHLTYPGSTSPLFKATIKLRK